MAYMIRDASPGRVVIRGLKGTEIAKKKKKDNEKRQKEPRIAVTGYITTVD